MSLTSTIPMRWMFALRPSCFSQFTLQVGRGHVLVKQALHSVYSSGYIALTVYQVYWVFAHTFPSCRIPNPSFSSTQIIFYSSSSLIMLCVFFFKSSLKCMFTLIRVRWRGGRTEGAGSQSVASLMCPA